MTRQFKNLFDNKSVCIVGRADYLKERDYGDFIDSHDVVVRVNSPNPHVDPEKLEWNYKDHLIDRRFWKRLGRRTDVLSIGHSHGILYAHTWLPGFINAGGSVVRYIENVRHIPDEIKDNLDMLDKKGLLSVITYDDFKALMKYYKIIEKASDDANPKFIPTSGIWSFDDLRKQSLNRLSVIGFTLWHPVEKCGNYYQRTPSPHPYNDQWLDLLLMHYAIQNDFRVQPDAELREIIDRRIPILSDMDRKVKNYD